MDSAKKKLFHHSKKADDDEPKKVRAHDEEEDEKDPLDDVDEPEESEQSEKSEQSEESEKMDTKDQDEDQTPVRSHPAVEEVEDDQTDGPKINFDYPQARTPSDVPRPVGGSNLDDLAQGDEEEYDGSQEPGETGQSAQRAINPYVKPIQQGQDIGIKSIRQPQPGPSFPTPAQFGGPQGGQNMNGNGNGGFRPQGQFSGPPAGGQGNFNFRREGSTKSGSNKVYFVVLLLIGLVVLGGAVYLLKNQLKPSGPKPSPSPEVAITTPEPSATPEAIDRSQFTIRVLNGSGKTGLAATVADKLKALGYKIEKTGNATNSAFERTLVRTLNDASLSAQLIKDLSDQSYDAASGSALKKGDASNGEVILGAK